MNSSTETHVETFKKGSTTYFYSSLFFPEPMRSHVFRLYGFVRKADNFVDAVPQDRDGFHAFRQAYASAMAGKESGDVIIDSFVALTGELDFDPDWSQAFLDAMEADLTKSEYRSLDETCRYMYGSAEVIGLYMAKIMQLPEESYSHARSLGRAMQYINFIRDIDEDQGLGRIYLPLVDTGLTSLARSEAHEKPYDFEIFIKREIERFREWQRHGEAGYRYIPRRYRVPIKTAMDMYLWTARQIEADPWIVYKRQIKPKVWRIVVKAAVNGVRALFAGTRGHGE